MAPKFSLLIFLQLGFFLFSTFLFFYFLNSKFNIYIIQQQNASINTSRFRRLVYSSQNQKPTTPTATPPPLPLLPVPNYSQLKWQQREFIMYFHFGINTFAGVDWSNGREEPTIFNPTGLNAGQWVDTASQAGASLVLLMAKHHDGFCLWPSKYTNYSVISSNWKNGHGDVVQELVDAAKTRHVDVGFSVSPWDRHEKSYGNDKAYNEYYLAQLQELLNKYGSVNELWLDGGKGFDAPDMNYYFDEWFAITSQLQTTINIFSDSGPGVRWIGDEYGNTGDTVWSTINRTSLTIGRSNITYLNIGDPKGTDWLPPECDVSIRKSWFWHKEEYPKNLKELLNTYYTTIGRNCVLLLNVPPNTTGLISNEDIQVLKQFRTAIDTIFSSDLAQNCSVYASSQRGGKGSDFGPENVLDNDHLRTYWAPEEEDIKEKHWIELKAMNRKVRFNVIRIQEAIGLGQRIARHEIYVDGRLVIKGTTIGYKRLYRLEKGAVNASSVRVKIIGSRSGAIPLISSIGLHFDPFWNPRGIHMMVITDE